MIAKGVKQFHNDITTFEFIAERLSRSKNLSEWAPPKILKTKANKKEVVGHRRVSSWALSGHATSGELWLRLKVFGTSRELTVVARDDWTVNQLRHAIFKLKVTEGLVNEDLDVESGALPMVMLYSRHQEELLDEVLQVVETAEQATAAAAGVGSGRRVVGSSSGGSSKEVVRYAGLVLADTSKTLGQFGIRSGDHLAQLHPLALELHEVFVAHRNDWHKQRRMMAATLAGETAAKMDDGDSNPLGEVDAEAEKNTSELGLVIEMLGLAPSTDAEGALAMQRALKSQVDEARNHFEQTGEQCDNRFLAHLADGMNCIEKAEYLKQSEWRVRVRVG